MINRLSILISLLFAFSSCLKTSVKLLTDKTIEKQMTKLENDETNQEVVFLPMVHIGVPEYYQSVREIFR